MKAIREILAAVRHADDLYNLIEEGDKIVVGVSGGKDSFCLLRVLHDYQKFSPVHFEIQPVMLDLGFDDFDPTIAVEYTKSLGMDLIVEECKEIYRILKMNTKDEKHLPCSICSRMRKASINRVALRLHYNKVAFAHHMDDAIETKLMNEIYGGREATFSPKMHLEKTDIVFIRPFILVREKQIERMVREEGIETMSSYCPADHHTMREEIKNDLKYIYKKYPVSYDNFPTALSNYKRLDLYNDKLELKLDNGYVISPVVMRDQMIDYINVVPPKALKNIDKDDELYLISYKKPLGAFTLKESNDEVVICDIYLKNKKDEVTTCLIKYFTEHKVPKKIVVK
ncbi:MAG: tRNA 2-thiocytidine(32) synthetase TtcA [Coprobacillus sp.]|nr:tRNA 2-thiocytidine(32) synthetase TtcA [Coprobacillus sp.]